MQTLTMLPALHHDLRKKNLYTGEANVVKFECRIVGHIKAHKSSRNRSKGSTLRGDYLLESGNF